jgi:hypothetical protein
MKSSLIPSGMSSAAIVASEIPNAQPHPRAQPAD